MTRNRTMTLIESPFSAVNERELVRNVYYTMLAVRDSLERGEAPYASHLFFTQMLDDTNQRDRDLGIIAGLDIGKFAKKSALYLDLGLSKGMEYGVKKANIEGRELIERQLFTHILDQKQLEDEIFSLASKQSLPEYEAILAIYGRILKRE